MPAYRGSVRRALCPADLAPSVTDTDPDLPPGTWTANELYPALALTRDDSCIGLDFHGVPERRRSNTPARNFTTSE